jgi:hypothetical protein
VVKAVSDRMPRQRGHQRADAGSMMRSGPGR